MTSAGPVRATVDGLGRLSEAEPALAMLQERCGGTVGGPLAIPQLAGIARLARRLGIVVSRSIVVADGDDDIDLWVRAQPDGDDVRLSLLGWIRRPGRPPAPASEIEREHDFLRAAADWLWETDDALRLTALSASAAAAIGEVSAALTGEPITRLFRFVQAPDGAMPILEALAERRSFDDQIATVANEPTRYRLAAVPVSDADGRFIGFRGTATTIAEEAGPAPAAAAGASPSRPQRMGSAFGERLDRALRSPLDRIVQSAETIRAQSDGPLRRDYADYASDIATAARHLLALVDDLVDLSAIESPEFAVLAERLDLAEMGRAASGLLSVRASDRGVHLRRPPADQAVPASGEYRRVLQILMNLIGNAVRYAPKGSAVAVTAGLREDGAFVAVRDSGPGIPAKDHARVFEKFERLDPSEPGGAGLGLYIARRLARAMGGDITLESAEGQGACFTLTLPPPPPERR